MIRTSSFTAIITVSVLGAYRYPEVYPRPDGTVYICGYCDNEPLPERADLIVPNQESLQGINNISKHISPLLIGKSTMYPLTILSNIHLNICAPHEDCSSYDSLNKNLNCV